MPENINVVGKYPHQTPQDIYAVIEKSMEGATQDPWSVDKYESHPGDTPEGVWHVFESLEDDPALATFAFVNAEADARFTARARSAVPYLLMRVRQAEELLQYWLEHHVAPEIIPDVKEDTLKYMKGEAYGDCKHHLA